MENETGTGFEDATTDALDDAQTETSTDEPAENGATETQTDQSTDTEETTLSDDDLAWAQKKGVDLEDKAAVAKMLRNADRKVSEADVKAKSTLQQAVDKTSQLGVDDDFVAEMENKYRLLETKFAATQYYVENPDDKQFDAEASAILEETVQTDPDFARALGRNLPKLFALAKQRHNEEQVAKAKEEGRREERTALASKQRASTTTPAATAQVPEDVDNIMAGLLAD